MTKRKDIQLFVFTHDKMPYALPDNFLYTPLQVGTSVRGKKLFKLSDNDIEDNISYLNGFFTETTGIYYIWKQLLNNPEWSSYEYIGNMQYRRLINFPVDFNFTEFFNYYDICYSDTTLQYNVYTQYKLSHIKLHIDDLINIIRELYPDYIEDALDVYMNNKLITNEGFIMKRQDYIHYCEFLFNILFVFLKKYNITDKHSLYQYIINELAGSNSNITIERALSIYQYRYQAGIGGFLAERIFTIYANHNFKKPFRVEYVPPIGYIPPKNNRLI